MYRNMRNVDDVTANAVDPPYPGHLLSVGSRSSEVARMQTYLNAIRTAYYHQLPWLSVDGIYGSGTQRAVRAYQTLVGLRADGIIGSNTWNSIVTNYNSIAGGGEYVWPGISLRSGSRSSDVLYMQDNLNKIHDVYLAVNHQAEDGIYGSNMTQAVRLFQKQFGLNADGVLGQQTWNRILTVMGNMTNPQTRNNVTPRYPGSPLRQGSNGDSVRFIQAYIDTVIAAHHYDWPILRIDGIYGTGTKNDVMAFQAVYGLRIDGVVGPSTWAKLVSECNIALHM